MTRFALRLHLQFSKVYESITYVTPHFSNENEILQFVSFHYWHNQNFGAEHSLNIS